MSSTERRRGGAGVHGHALRVGQSHKHTGGSANVSNAAGPGKDGPAGTTGGGMPAAPPKVAMPNSGASSPDEPLESRDTAPTGGSGGGVPLLTSTSSRKDKGSASPGRRGTRSRDRTAKDKEASSTPATTATSTAATATALREKDDRIAHLEKELATMEREFHREIDQMSQNESETAVFWQGKHSALHQQFLRTDMDLRVLQSKAREREAERDELRRGWDVMRREAAEREAQVRGLQGQIRGLKEFVSTSTRSDGSACDEDLGEGMARLGNGLQNWVIVHFRKAKLDLSRVDEATLAEVGELVPMYEELASTAKVHLLQSIVSRILVEMVFEAYYVGLTEDQMKHFRQVEGLLSSFASSSDEPINQWRSSTLALLRREGTDRLRDETQTFISTIVTRINRVLTSLLSGPPTSSASDPARDTALRAQVSHAVDLSRLLRAQKAVLRVSMPVVLPHQRTPFEPVTMEDIGGEVDDDDDDDGGRRREVRCVTFPALIKRGDESGGRLHFENVIAKARVLCSVDS